MMTFMNRLLEKFTLRQIILIAFIIVIVFVVLTIFTIFPARMAQQAQMAMENKALTITHMTAYTCEASLVFEDVQGVKDAIDNARQDPDVSFVYVFDASGQIFTAHNPEILQSLHINLERLAELTNVKMDFEESDYQVVYKPIQHDGEKIGGILVGLNLDELKEQIRRNIFTTVGLSSLIIILVGVLATLLVSRHLANKIDPILEVVNNVAGGDLRQEIIVSGRDEISDLARNFNLMISNTKEIIGKVQEAVMKLDSSAKDIQNGVQNQASTSSQQSASISETTATMEELAQTSRQIAHSTDEVVEVARRTENAAQSGVNAANDTFKKMEEVASKNRESINEIVDLGKKSERINEIMEIINTITDQTKLIAFNAAIEAAAAGEAGHRFGIVATEIRRLADDVEKSTSEIKSKINEIQRAINKLVIASEEGTRRLNEGVNFTKLTVSSLEEILNGAQATTTSAKEISLGTQQQRTASEQIVGALKEINEGTKHFVVTANQTSVVTNELSNLSQELRQLVNRFKVS